MSKKKEIKFGAIIQGGGAHTGLWRHPDLPVDASVSLEFYKRQAQAAEAGKRFVYNRAVASSFSESF